jgi:hypothetical protein
MGFYSVIPRALTVVISSVLPSDAWAVAIHVSAVAIMAAVFAMPAGRAYAWLLPDARLRAALVAMLCLAPGLNEMAGNFANLPWVFFYALVFIGLRDPREPVLGWQLALSAGLIASMAQAVFAIPLFLWRVAEGLQSRRPASHVLRSGAIMAMLCAALPVLWLAREPDIPALPLAPLPSLALTLLRTTVDSVLLLPLLGERLSTELTAMAGSAPRLLAAAAAGALLLYGVARAWPRPGLRPVLLLLAGVICWPAVSWVSRPGNLGAFQAPLGEWFTHHRYAFPTAAAASLLWLFLLQASRLSRRWQSGLSLALVVIALGVGGDRFWIEPYGREWRWRLLVPTVDRSLRTGCPARVAGPIYPGRWVFEYERPQPAECGH